MSKQYVKKPEPVTARPYCAGLEDGWAYFIPAAGGGRLLVDLEPTAKYQRVARGRDEACVMARDCIAGKYPLADIDPVVQSAQGWCSVRGDDYIVDDGRGGRYAVAKDVFESTFTPVEDLRPAT